MSPHELFHVKICGIRLKRDVEAVEHSAADAVGLNFFPPSVRFVDPDAPETAQLADAARQAGLLCVGVFVNEPPERVLQVARRLQLDAVQLHGDEPLAAADPLRDAGLALFRAIKLPPGTLDVETVRRVAEPWHRVGARLLLDADAGAAYGGSGRQLDWSGLRRWAEQSPEVSWTLAGGLTPENVAEAIRASGAESVDVASGVERPRGSKCPDRIGRFAAEAAAAFTASRAG